MMFPQSTPYQQNIRPGFIGDFLSREHVLPGGIKLDPAQFPGADAIKVTVGTGGAAAAATAVPVVALPGPVPAGTLLDFGGAKFARLTAAAAAGAVSLAVAALPTALVAGDVAYYNDPKNRKRVAGGTLVGLTNAELEAAATSGVKWGPAADADDVVYLLAWDTPDVVDNNNADVLRKGTLIKVNNLPGWDTMSAALKAKIRAMYECTVGAPGQEVAPNAANPPA